eukprot:398414_1
MSVHWLRKLRLSTAEIKDLLTTCKEPTLNHELNTFFINNYSTNKYYIEYNGFLSNHISHGMIALWKLKCTESTIHNFMKWYKKEKNLQSFTTSNKSSNNTMTYKWKDLYSWIGTRSNFYDIYNMMKTDLENKTLYNNNISTFISDRFPLFSNGQSGSLLHGLIHLGFGITCMNKQIILEGMSYIPHSYLQFDYKTPINNTHGGNTDILSVFNLIRKEGKLKKCLQDNFHKVEHIPLGLGQQPLICLSKYGQNIINKYISMFIGTIPLITINCDENRNMYMNQLSKLKKYLLCLMVMLYTYGNGLDYNDFVLLHGVTAAYSVTQILPYLKSIHDINRTVLQFISVAVATFVIQFEANIEIGLEESKLKYDENKGNWKYLMAGIVYNLKNDANNGIFYDEHVYKLVFVVLECLEYDIVDEEMAYYAIRKAAEKPLIIRTIGHQIKDLRAKL